MDTQDTEIEFLAIASDVIQGSIDFNTLDAPPPPQMHHFVAD